jgi:hypothetical protein
LENIIKSNIFRNKEFSPLIGKTFLKAENVSQLNEKSFFSMTEILFMNRNKISQSEECFSLIEIFFSNDEFSS